MKEEREEICIHNKQRKERIKKIDRISYIGLAIITIFIILLRIFFPNNSNIVKKFDL